MSIKKTSEQFIKQAKQIHSDKYDYSLVNYNGNHYKVNIICKEHGIFKQEAIVHLKGCGCPKCRNNLNGIRCKFTIEQFIQKAKQVHGNKYDYSLVKYININTKVIIICKCHGEFLQTPAKHLIGQGCSSCRTSKGELKIKNFLNEHNIKFESPKRFPDCKFIKPLPFDFYLPEVNTCIEYDGMQHFKPVKYWGGEENFIKIQRNDQIKNNYCLNKGIKLLRINANILDLHLAQLIPV